MPERLVRVPYPMLPATTRRAAMQFLRLIHWHDVPPCDHDGALCVALGLLRMLSWGEMDTRAFDRAWRDLSPEAALLYAEFCAVLGSELRAPADIQALADDLISTVIAHDLAASRKRRLSAPSKRHTP